MGFRFVFGFLGKMCAEAVGKKNHPHEKKSSRDYSSKVSITLYNPSGTVTAGLS